MEIIVFRLGQYQTNCYLIIQDKSCFIIDPGTEDQQLINYLNTNNLKPEFIVITHGHFDHVGGVKQLKETFKIPVYAPKLDSIWFEVNEYNYLNYKIPVDHWLNDSDELQFQDKIFKVFSTPGHTLGSIALYHKPYLFVGDTLFYQSIGRTDLAFGNFNDLKKSIEKLYQLFPNETIVYPGHGRPTTIQHEKLNNPFLPDN